MSGFSLFRMRSPAVLLTLGLLLGVAMPSAWARKIVFIAGTKSHGYGAHEFNAGCLLLQKLLKETRPDIETAVAQNGWPKDPALLQNADDDFRKVVLNATLWIARIPVPEGGLDSSRPTTAELELNQDYPKPKNFKLPNLK